MKTIDISNYVLQNKRNEELRLLLREKSSILRKLDGILLKQIEQEERIAELEKEKEAL